MKTFTTRTGQGLQPMVNTEEFNMHVSRADYLQKESMFHAKIGNTSGEQLTHQQHITGVHRSASIIFHN